MLSPSSGLTDKYSVESERNLEKHYKDTWIWIYNAV